ncbi:TPA: glycosyltransferase [Vibrio vulnificus]|nr:glycosyltransferase [Vibrio vulnificus]
MESSHYLGIHLDSNDKERKMKVVHIISALYQGGAESQLEKLIDYSSRNSGTEHVVISLKDDQTELMVRLRNKGISVYTLGMNRVFSFRSVINLIKLLNAICTTNTIVQCWMYHANLLGFIASTLSSTQPKVVWNIRRTQLPKGITGLVSNICSFISNISPVSIVCCAQSAKESHILGKYSEKHMVVISNGIDTNLFVQSEAAREKFRSKLGIETHQKVIGMVARFELIKGHKNLLDAFHILVSDRKLDDTFLVLVGRNIRGQSSICGYLNSDTIGRKIVLVEETQDIWNIYPGFDVLCMPSLSEGFPNVVAEAMSCGVGVVATDVGDAANIISNPGNIVEPQNAVALADCLERYISKLNISDHQISDDLRASIQSRYSIEVAWKRYENLYKSIL